MMDQVLSALKCVNCRDTLSKPVLLPCGHTICQSHTEKTDAQIICFKCGCRHFNTGFVINEAVSDMIKAQLYNFDFGQQHKETSKSFEKLKKQLDKNNLVLNDLEYFIHESIGELRNQVMLKSEQLKLRIDEISQELIDDLDEYEKRCKRQSGDINRTESFISMTNEIKEFDKGAIKIWEDGSRILNELKFDSDKWREIKAKCDETLQKMCKNLKHFEKEVFLNEFSFKKRHIEFFEKANIDIILKSNYNSQILNSELFARFSELCSSKIKINAENVKLLYRATRDGFGAANFHANCDGQSKTVTIIESTRGYIFGGYSKCCWSSGKHVFCHDSNAFLFSLVNKFKKPFLSSILPKEESKAICCNSDYGAIFGYYDIYVSNDSNLSTDSFAVFKSYQKPGFINDPNGFYLCDSKHFQAKEIEVFQIE